MSQQLFLVVGHDPLDHEDQADPLHAFTNWDDAQEFRIARFIAYFGEKEYKRVMAETGPHYGLDHYFTIEGLPLD